MWWLPFLSATPVVWVGLHLEQQSLFTRHFDVEYLQRNSSCVKSTLSWHARHTYMTFVEEIHTYANTHDRSQTQTSAWVLSAAALVHRNTGALALRSAVRYTLLCKSDWDTQKDPVLSLRLPYKEQQSRLRESSSVLWVLNLQPVCAQLVLPLLSEAPSPSLGLRLQDGVYH